MVVQRTTETCEFRLYLPHASVVEVVGDFTRWQESAVAMSRGHNGWWEAILRVPVGEHRFSYLVDGRYWMPDYAANGVEHNADGQWVSRLDVEAAEGASTPPRETRRAGTPGRAAEPVVTVMSRALAVVVDAFPGVSAARTG